MKIINNIKNNIDEFLSALYLWMFSLTRIFISNFIEYSFYILLFFSTMIIVLSFFLSKKTRKLNSKVIIIIFVVLVGFIISALVTPNPVLIQRIYEFIIYGVISIYLFSKIGSLKKFFEFFAYLSVVSFYMHFLDPLNNYKIFGDYMSFGFNCMLLVFCGCSIGTRFYNKKIFIITKYLSLFELAIFCNKGALVTGLFLELLFFLLKNENATKKIIKVILLLIFIFLIYFQFNNLLLMVVDKLKELNINSYSITSIYKSLLGITNGLAGRDNIWANAISFFSERCLFGHGIGAFDYKFNIYTHNIFLDILCSHGVCGLSIFVVFVISYIVKLIKAENAEKYCYMFFIAIGLIPLIFSIYTFKWQFFWIFLYVGFFKKISYH